MQPVSGNQRPDPCTAPATENASFQILPRRPSFLEMLENPHDLLTLTRCTIPCACHAKRHLNVHFDLQMCFAPQRRAIFISHLASWLRTRRFSEPTFRTSGASNHRKNTVYRDFPTFSRTWIFFLLKLSLFWSSFLFSFLL